ncbi:hypothetical protein C8J57DRAFT_1235225 [Mycena rebaudengoi]|nr:hypothetical protein C8J57DRAFT_1235225 [Mycena rebaudengoi]
MSCLAHIYILQCVGGRDSIKHIYFDEGTGREYHGSAAVELARSRWKRSDVAASKSHGVKLNVTPGTADVTTNQETVVAMLEILTRRFMSKEAFNRIYPNKGDFKFDWGKFYAEVTRRLLTDSYEWYCGWVRGTGDPTFKESMVITHSETRLSSLKRMRENFGIGVDDDENDCLSKIPEPKKFECNLTSTSSYYIIQYTVVAQAATKENFGPKMTDLELAQSHTKRKLEAAAHHRPPISITTSTSIACACPNGAPSPPTRSPVASSAPRQRLPQISQQTYGGSGHSYPTCAPFEYAGVFSSHSSFGIIDAQWDRWFPPTLRSVTASHRPAQIRQNKAWPLAMPSNIFSVAPGQSKYGAKL